jgi:hypothetical protein
MKKVILILVVLALVVPATAMAATEFSLGGWIKLDSMWDSSVTNKNLVSKIYRDNDPANQHGRLRMMATGSRFNFTIKGPKLWGAQVTGFIEADWDANGAATPPGADSADIGAFRLRHAMFRLTWPETELMMGQYWSFFSEFFPETAADGGFHYRGANVYRPAQIRITQKFLGVYTAGFMVGTNRLGAGSTGALNEQSETPHLEAKFAYEQDLYGKAAYYGKPRGLVAQLVAGWQRTYYRGTRGANINPLTMDTFGNNSYWWSDVTAPAAWLILGPAPSQMLNHWSVQGSLFIPVITTSSANLAGTASILTQWAIGQGQFFTVGTWATDDMYLHYNGTQWERVLTPAIRGFVQGQYYFTNEWFLNVCWGYYHANGLSYERETPGGAFSNAFATSTFPVVPTLVNAGANDFVNVSNQIAATLWFRPIQAIKFGLSYAYTQDRYFQATAYTPGGLCTNAGNVSRIGEDHRVEFAGFYYF